MTEFIENSENSNNALNVIVEGSMWKAIWQMSWPSLIHTIMVSSASFFDVFVSGTMNSVSQAAVGIFMHIWHFTIIAIIALTSGTTAVVSRFYGEGDRLKTIESAKYSLLFASIFALICTIVGLALTLPILGLLNLSAPLVEESWALIRVELLCTAPVTVMWTVNSIFRATGDARTPMSVMVLMTAMTIVLESIFCLSPIKMGVTGIGLAWLISESLCCLLSLRLLAKSKLGIKLDFGIANNVKEAMSWAKRLFRIGIPACIQDVFWIFANFSIVSIVAHTDNPTVYQAGWTIGLRVEDLLITMPIYSLFISASTIIGQNLGAKNPERAEAAGWKITAAGVAYSVLAASIMYLFAGQIAGCLTEDARAARSAAEYLKINALSAPFTAAFIVLAGAMEGAGYTKVPMYLTFICFCLVRIPLVLYMCFNLAMSATGIWTAIAISSVLTGILTTGVFKLGYWKKQVV